MQIFAVTKPLQQRYKSVTGRYKNVTSENFVFTRLSVKEIEHHRLNA